MADPTETFVLTYLAGYDKEEKNLYGPCRLIYRASQAGNGPTPRPLDSDYAGLENDQDLLEALDGGSHAVSDDFRVGDSRSPDDELESQDW